MSVGVLGDNVKIQKICNLHQIIKYIKFLFLPIFCAKFLIFFYFLALGIPIFLFF